jgi:hypothetical protein
MSVFGKRIVSEVVDHIAERRNTYHDDPQQDPKGPVIPDLHPFYAEQF